MFKAEGTVALLGLIHSVFIKDSAYGWVHSNVTYINRLMN